MKQEPSEVPRERHGRESLSSGMERTSKDGDVRLHSPVADMWLKSTFAHFSADM